MIRAVTCACRDSLAEVVRLPSGLQLVHCRACDLYARREAPAPRALELFYEQEYPRQFAAEQSGPRDNLQAHALRRIESRAARLKAVSDHRPGARRFLIDVGCGNGRLLELAQQAGWSVMGLDPSGDRNGKRRTGGIEMRQAAWPLTDISGHSADAIVWFSRGDEKDWVRYHIYTPTTDPDDSKLLGRRMALRSAVQTGLTSSNSTTMVTSRSTSLVCVGASKTPAGGRLLGSIGGRDTVRLHVMVVASEPPEEPRTACDWLGPPGKVIT